MRTSETAIELYKSFVKFQSEVTQPKKNATNPHFKSAYSTLDEIIKTVTPVLSKYGLAAIQEVTSDGMNVTVITRLIHESGEWMETEPLVMKCDKQTAQGQGSAATYGRRYSLSAILGISSEEDDDGNAAAPKTRSDAREGTKTRSNPPPHSGTDNPTQSDVCTDAQRKKIYAVTKNMSLEPDTVKQMMADKCSVNSSKELTKKQASEFIEWLTKLENGQETWTPPDTLPFEESEIPFS